MSPGEDEFAASLGGIWSALHRDARLAVRESEIHGLQLLAIAADDELVSQLLLRKLRLARVARGDGGNARLVSLNSFLEYRFDGKGTRFGQLVHPTRYPPSCGIEVTSLIGAGLLGLSAGQTILWPNSAGTLCDLEVVHVENCPGLSGWVRDRPAENAAMD